MNDLVFNSSINVLKVFSKRFLSFSFVEQSVAFLVFRRKSLVLQSSYSKVNILK